MMIDDRTEVIQHTLNKILRENIYKTSRTIQIKILEPATTCYCGSVYREQKETKAKLVYFKSRNLRGDWKIYYASVE